MRNCPWSDIIMGVAWSVWHNEKLFKQMKNSLKCKVPSASKRRKEVEWSKWLADENETRTAYNIHDLWIWYSKSIVGG